MLVCGVGLFIKTSPTAKCRKDMTTSTDEFETIWVEIDNNKYKIMIGVIYPHSNSDLEMDNTIKKQGTFKDQKVKY